MPGLTDARRAELQNMIAERRQRFPVSFATLNFVIHHLLSSSFVVLVTLRHPWPFRTEFSRFCLLLSALEKDYWRISSYFRVVKGTQISRRTFNVRQSPLMLTVFVFLFVCLSLCLSKAKHRTQEEFKELHEKVPQGLTYWLVIF